MLAELQRRKFVVSREPLSDEEFCSRSGASPELWGLVVATREAMARICHVPASSLYPDDLPENTGKLAEFDWDDGSVVLELEEILGCEVHEDLPQFLGRRFFWHSEPGPRTLGEWCVRVAQELK